MFKITRLTLINIVLTSLLVGIFLSPMFFGGFGNFRAPGVNTSADPLSDSQQAAALTLQRSYINVYKKTAPSVVYIKTNTLMRRGYWLQYNQMVEGAGSGFIIDKEGYIVTNSHVVAGARKIEVIFHDNRKTEAKLIGRDDSSDIALIKVTPDKYLTPSLLGDSDKVEPGQLAFAIGAPFGLNRTFTVGTISAKERKLDNARFSRLQTDASINPGNSGGPLLNVYGEVVGINQSIISPGRRSQAGSVGIGFAIPINQARQIIEQLKKERRVLGRPAIGVKVGLPTDALRDQLKLDGDLEGVIVFETLPGSKAEQAGLKANDFVVKANGKAVKEVNEFVREVQNVGIGGTVSLEIIRKGRPMKIDVKVGEIEK